MTRHAAAKSVLAGLLALGTAVRSHAVDPNPARLAPTEEQAQRAKELTAKLGDPVFQVRDDATRGLRRLGRAALPALNATLSSTPDPEVRDRCEALLPAIAEADLKVRLEVFLSDIEGKYEHKLPGWYAFGKVAGTTADARKLFAEACQTKVNVELIQGLDLPKDQYEKLVMSRRLHLYQTAVRYSPTGGRTPAKPADVATLLFAESAVPITNRSYYYAITSLLSQNRETLTGATGEPLRKLVVNWMDTRTHYLDISQAVSLAGILNVKEIPAAKYAEKLLAEEMCPLATRLNALSVVARTGGAEYLPTLMKALDNKTKHTVRLFVNGGQTTHEIEVRDVALVMCLLVTQQKPEDYGVEVKNPNFFNDTAKFSYTYYAFADEKKRAAAFAKWAAWHAKQPKMPPAAAPDKMPPAEKK